MPAWPPTPTPGWGRTRSARARPPSSGPRWGRPRRGCRLRSSRWVRAGSLPSKRPSPGSRSTGISSTRSCARPRTPWATRPKRCWRRLPPSRIPPPRSAAKSPTATCPGRPWPCPPVRCAWTTRPSARPARRPTAPTARRRSKDSSASTKPSRDRWASR